MLGTLAILAAATATVTVTLCKAKVTAPVREQVSRRSPFLAGMLKCLYCTSHWVAAGFALLAPDLDLGGGRVLNWLVAALAIVMFSAPMMWIINMAHGTMRWPPE